MATFKNDGRKNFSVSIRRKGHNITKTFSDKETAELYAKYKEALIDEMENFDVPKKDLITLDSAIECRLEELLNAKADRRTVLDVKGLRGFFPEFMNLTLSELTYEMLKNKIEKMMVEPIRRGGDRDKTGKLILQSPVTIRRKVAMLSSIYSLMIKKGVDCENIPLRILSFLHEIIKKKKKE